MARYIDADKFIEWLDAGHFRSANEVCLSENNVIKMIKSQPTADVVEVVRCKDCKHWGGVVYGFVCRKFSGIETKICMGADHFCSYGERKEKNDSESV